MIPSMKTRAPMPAEQWWLAALLLLLIGLAALLWLEDPAHQLTGHSRVDWPEPASRPPR